MNRPINENNASLIIRLPKKLKEVFMKLCIRNDQTASQAVRAFIRKAVEGK